MIITMSLSQALHITHAPQGNDLKPNSCENHDNKWWTLVTYKVREEEACTNKKDNYNKNLNGEKGNWQNDSLKVVKKSILVREEVLSTQSLRKLITLNEYMPKELKGWEICLLLAIKLVEGKLIEKSHNDFILASRCIRHEDILKK
jgi:hypothetical protein